MNFNYFEKALSYQRLARYTKACKQDTVKALSLYRLNIQLSKELFGILAIFEVLLRNAIDMHYSNQFVSNDWLKEQADQNGIFCNVVFRKGNFETRNQINKSIQKLGVRYSHDQLVASLTIGFYVYLFNNIQFRLAGQTLHQIFINRPNGTLPKNIFNDLVQIRDFRNRIAHHEPVCFNGKNQINTASALENYLLIVKYTYWLGYDPTQLYQDLDQTLKFIQNIDSL